MDLREVVEEAGLAPLNDVNEISLTPPRHIPTGSTETLDVLRLRSNEEHLNEARDHHIRQDAVTRSGRSNKETNIRNNKPRNNLVHRRSESERSDVSEGSLFEDDQASESDEGTDSRVSSNEGEFASIRSETSQERDARHSQKESATCGLDAHESSSPASPQTCASSVGSIFGRWPV